MKFKMSDKSLFAILLRSPWWISLLIVLVISLAAKALLPAQYVAVGVLGSFPFVVIAVMAAWRQARQPSAAQVTAVLERAGALSWREFAAWVTRAFERQGFTVTALTGEAADFRLEKLGQTSLVSCRRWKAATHGVEQLRQLEAARVAQGARQALYLSLGPVSDAAGQQAKEAGIRLVHGPELGQLLVKTDTK